MSLFCFFLIPSLYLWRRSSVCGKKVDFPEPGLISGFVFGLAAAIFRFSVGEIFVLRGFGLSAFAVQLIDGASFDASLPIVVHALIRRFGRPARKFNETESVAFSLAWLTPLCAFRALYWSSVPDPVRLMVIPILIAVLALALPYWIGRIIDDYGFFQAVAILLVVFAPFAVAATTWALYTHHLPLGAIFFCLSVSLSIPAVIKIASPGR